MNLLVHFNGYRDSVRKDAFAECVDYARSVATARPADFPTAYDFLSYALTAAKKAATEDQVDLYRRHLGQHQLALTSLLERMVAEVLWDYKNVSESDVLRLIGAHGWSWFKFCEKPLDVKLNIGTDLNPVVRWVPRYVKKFSHLWDKKGTAVFDSDELELLVQLKPSPTAIVHTMLRFKLENPGQKILAIKGGVVSYKPVEKLNMEGGVDDWSLPLFS